MLNSFWYWVRLASVSPASEAASAFWFICLRMSVSWDPAEIVVSITDLPLFSESFTASKAEFWFFCVSAMAQMAPLSLAVATFSPVEMRFWVVESAMLVAFKFSSATKALWLVLMLFTGVAPHPCGRRASASPRWGAALTLIDGRTVNHVGACQTRWSRRCP